MQAHPSRDNRGKRSDDQVDRPGPGNNDPKREEAGHSRQRAAQHLAISLLRCQPQSAAMRPPNPQKGLYPCGKISLADFLPSIGPKAYVVFAIVSRDKASTWIGCL